MSEIIRKARLATEVPSSPPPLPAWVRSRMPGIWAPLGSVWVGEVSISPPDACWMLENKRGRQRPLIGRNVCDLKAFMRAGIFLLNGETLVFDWNEHGVNLQHRLTALSGLPNDFRQNFLVVYGVDPMVWDTFDQQGRRTVAHLLAREEVQNPAIVASMGLGILNFLLGGKVRVGHQIPGVSIATITDILQRSDRLPGVNESAAFPLSLPKTHVPRFKTIPTIALFHWLFARVDSQAANDFWTAQLSVTPACPAPAGWHSILHSRLGDNIKKNAKLTPNYTYALIIKAWNNLRSNKPYSAKSVLKLVDEEKFPRIAGWSYGERNRPAIAGLSATSIPELNRYEIPEDDADE